MICFLRSGPVKNQRNNANKKRKKKKEKKKEAHTNTKKTENLEKHATD